MKKKFKRRDFIKKGTVGGTVALAAATICIKKGFQVALMCPTESLAIQHFITTQNILTNNVNISLLTSSTKKSEKKLIIVVYIWHYAKSKICEVIKFKFGE